MVDGKKTRVAVVGARGIGKHHAVWWTLEGAYVCAFVGTSEESVAETHATLKGLFPFEGRGYTSLEAMLETESPDIVDVCSPPPCHFDHVRTALDAGCHVLCEKPFVYARGVPTATLMAQAGDLVDLAERKGLRLGVCTQYAAGARIFCRIWARIRDGEPVTAYHGHLESPAKGRPPDPERVWVDLSPHMISVMLYLAPEGKIDWGSLETHFEGYEAIARFSFRRSGLDPLHCEIYTRNATDPPRNVRHFKFNDYRFIVEGQKDDHGVYCARIETSDGNIIEPDMMRLLIRDFLAGTPTVAGKDVLSNLDLMLKLLEAAQR